MQYTNLYIMKRNFHFYKNSAFTPMRFIITKFNDLLTRNSQAALIAPFKAVLLACGLSITRSKITLTVMFIIALRKRIKHNGIKGSVQYLKACGVLIQQGLGGHIVPDTGLIAGLRIARSNSKYRPLPRIIPASERVLIRQGNLAVAKYWLSVINLYRLMVFEGKVNINSITDEHNGIHDSVLETNLANFIPTFVRHILSFGGKAYLSVLTSSHRAFPIVKTAPGTSYDLNEFSTQPHILFAAVCKLFKGQYFIGCLYTLAEASNNSTIMSLFKQGMDLRNEIASKVGEVPSHGSIGKLGFINEPAGKIRVIAMVDGWSQWILKPFHSAIFHILKFIPMDGTFDQLRPLDRLDNSKGLWSLDLTAATDRLPMDLQRLLFAELFGEKVAGAWALLLARPYRAGAMSPAPGKHWYGVGQPMGALTSWAMLALTHHLIVQFAAFRCGKYPYTNYALLGDDLVLGDQDVATAYLEILTSLGVKCGLHKSIVSPRGLALEFAKKTFVFNKREKYDISPVPLKELSSATKTMPGFRAFMLKYGLTFANALRAFGAGFKTYGNVMKPFGKLNSFAKMATLVVNIPTTQEDVAHFFMELGAPKSAKYRNGIQTIETLFKAESSKLLERANVLYMKLLHNSMSTYGNTSLATFTKSLEEFISEKFDHRLEVAIEKAEASGRGGAIWRDYLAKIAAEKVTSVSAVTDPGLQYSIGKYFHSLVQAQWAPKLAEISGIIARIERLDPKVYSLQECWTALIEINECLTDLADNAFVTVRPEMLEEDRNHLITPAQIRLWRRWTPLLQGTQPLLKEESKPKFPNIHWMMPAEDIYIEPTETTFPVVPFGALPNKELALDKTDV